MRAGRQLLEPIPVLIPSLNTGVGSHQQLEVEEISTFEDKLRKRWALVLKQAEDRVP